MRVLLLSGFVVFIHFIASAQTTGNTAQDIPLMRKMFHENINQSQKALFSLDGKQDDRFAPSNDDEINNQITHAATVGVDNLQNEIEANPSTDANTKIKFLRGLNEVLTGYISQYRQKQIKGTAFPQLIRDYKSAMDLELQHHSILPVIKKNSYETGNLLINSIAFKDNVDAAACRNDLMAKYLIKYPERILPTLSEKPDLPFADSLIIKAAYTQQENLYTYAAATNSFAGKIGSVNDPLVKIIYKMAKMKTGRQYFPFLDNLYKGKITFEEIEGVMDNDEKYYSLLVKTELDYASRVIKKDTPMAMLTLTNRLRFKAKEVYINEINGLHEKPDNIRFKSIEKLTPQELYYLAVLGEEEIYTSSYVNGVYPRIWKGKMQKGDSLLMSVYFDHFKKWIKMAANYNTLDNFLGRMDKQNAEMLMVAFVRGLDKTQNLEDAVDVANSYSSIKDPAIKRLILSQVQYNLEQARKTRNVKATRIYGILNTIFQSIDPNNKIDLTATLGIPPVYSMPNAMMKDGTGRIIIQQFFYGDKDGTNVFNSFLSNMSNGNWKIIPSAKWVEVRSTKGTPISIYSNRPLDETKGLDADAQAALGQYLTDKGLDPTMVIHRGHSYYLISTLQQLAPSAKVVLLGSCGGYQSLSTVLNTCPTAQIISSKQTGSGLINMPMISAIVETLRQGKDLDWPGMWSNLEKRFAHNALFDDYVPPYKNLGAVFIMAYKKMEDRDGMEE